MDTYDKAMKYARRVAGRMMGNDGAADDIADSAAMRAVKAYDPSRGVSLRLFVALCVRRDVWCCWRSRVRRKEEQRDLDWWTKNVISRDEEPDLDGHIYTLEDWQILVESYHLRWPLDVIARRRGVSVYRMRKKLDAAMERFLADVVRSDE